MNPTSEILKLKEFNSTIPHSSLYAKLLPCSQRYISGLNPINLFELKQPLKDLSSFKSVMVRDGLMTLSSFFENYPSPLELKTQLLIHESFLSFVPFAWREQVLAYTYYHQQLRPFGKINPEDRSLIVKGILNEFFSPAHLRQEMAKLKTYKKIFFMPTSKDDQMTGQKLLVEAWDILKEFSKDVRIASSEDIKRETDFTNIDFIDLNSTGLMYMDDYTDVYLLSRGSTPALSRPEIFRSEIKHYPITPHHGITVLKPLFDKEYDSSYGTKWELQGYVKKMANLNLAYKHSTHLMIKILPDKRISLLHMNDLDSMFIVDGLMTEVFHDLAHGNLTLNQILKKQLDDFEDSEHSQLTEHITKFFDDLINRSMIDSL